MCALHRPRLCLPGLRSPCAAPAPPCRRPAHRRSSRRPRRGGLALRPRPKLRAGLLDEPLNPSSFNRHAAILGQAPTGFLVGLQHSGPTHQPRQPGRAALHDPQGHVQGGAVARAVVVAAEHQGAEDAVHGVAASGRAAFPPDGCDRRAPGPPDRLSSSSRHRQASRWSASRSLSSRQPLTAVPTMTNCSWAQFRKRVVSWKHSSATARRVFFCWPASHRLGG